MSGTIRERIALPDEGRLPQADEVATLAPGNRAQEWARAMERARCISYTEGRRVLAIVTPGRSRGFAWLDLYVEPRP